MATTTNNLLLKVSCGYLYNEFKVLQATVDAVKELLNQSLNVLDSLLDAALVLLRDVLDQLVNILLTTIESLYEVMNNIIRSYLKKGSDALKKVPVICSELWKCLAFVNALLDDSYIQRLFNLTGSSTFVDALQDIVNDLNTFRTYICDNFNFSINFGLAYCKKMAVSCKKLIDEYYDLAIQYKLKIRNMIESYMSLLNTMGITAIILKLSDLATCIFSVSDSDCTNIATAANYSKNLQMQLCFKQSGTGDLEFDSTKYKQYVKKVENITSNLKTADNNLDRLIDILCKPLNVGSSSDAYNLNSTICKIGTYVKNGFKTSDLKKIELVQYAIADWTTLSDAWQDMIGNTSDTTDADTVLQYTNVKSDGSITFTNPDTGEIESTSVIATSTTDTVYLTNDADTSSSNTMMIEEDTNRILSIGSAAYKCSLYEFDPVLYKEYEKLYRQCKKAYSNLNTNNDAVLVGG